MLLCLDAHYEDRAATTACIGFSDWTDADAVLELVVRSRDVPAPYEPGQFYKRELPLLMVAIERMVERQQAHAVIVDAHVWLDGGRPGLGAHLYEALDRRIPVVGVAKSPFRGGDALPVLRGASRHPLFVTAAGIEPARAADLVRAMHGEHRVPTLLRRVDRLARGHEQPDPAKAV